MLSVVIPTLNSESGLADCLDRMKGADEIIVVDGGSADSTTNIAERLGARLVIAPKGRGSQLRAGAEAALGDWLLFLHSDTLPSPAWNDAVARHVRDHPGKAGCFAFRLADRAWQARLIEHGVRIRVRWFGLPYGDQGLLVSRALYDEAGGYRPLPLMEDVDLVWRIGGRRLRLLDAEAWTSAERWRREGWLRRSARNLLCLSLYRIGFSPDRLARFYA
ncbi:MAG TPA: TIGR04283 family arsenosugar biosynthesis glycosyltransferase [Allosphingosinicella sp.]|nr:TIGR04283 family arsenosugar biosynthesis glycosyltransferase [Allosphingosinicella sp.]